MLFLRIGPNDFTFSTLIHSCTELKDHNCGKQLHASAIKVGLESDVFVGSSLIDHYVKFGSVGLTQRVFEDLHQPNVVSYTALICAYMKNERFEEALRIFRNMPERNVVSWNAVISAFSQKGHNEEAINLFVDMCREAVEPNESTYPCVFTAAANITAIGMGKSFHAYAIKTLVKQDIYVTNSLISFYAKCGNMEDSLLAFERISAKNVVSWNALICGYAQNGRGKDALELFQRMRMKETGFKPNEITLLCLLFACNHAGLVHEGYAYFDQTRREEPHMLQSEHYACVINLLSRSGLFEEAKSILQELPFNPGIGFWKALLGGTQVHPNTELAELAARKILALDPEDSSSYILLSNLYSAVGNWKKASMIRKEMKEKGMKKVPGSSWIEIRNKLHIFVNREIRHLQEDDEIYRLLRVCFEHSKENPCP
ncbi:pentatricopeptide repeat-containing protein At5g42450, mitochondrial [Aristolochia californica]|uniref:pentatricopeptide repeat-containing protein At5g42450, mitochondrial n=1 Tax=Aristolochia californica TaxID=171875 RepID=UPI0035D728F7